MNNLLIQGADVITLDAGTSWLPATDLAISGSVIVGVGAIPEDFQADQVLDASGYIVMPGMYNGHTHSGTVLHRGLGHSADIYAAPDGETAYLAAQLAMAEMIRSGTAGFSDQYYYMDRVAEAVATSGMRAVLSWCTYDREDGVIGGDLAAVARFVEEWNGAANGRIRTVLGPHSVGACSPMFLARSAAVAARLGVGVHIHLAETAAEVDAALAEYEMTPVEVLDKNGIFDVPVTGVHAIHLTHVDIDILAERGASVVYCPSVHVLAGLGRAPVELLQAAGVSVGLGTEGAESGYTLSMLQAVRDASACAASVVEEEPVARFLDALSVATQGSAEVLGFPLSGKLGAGRCADLVMVDRRRVHLSPGSDPLAALARGVGPGDVSDVMVDGRWLLRAGELQTIDEERVLHEANRRGFQRIF